MEVKMKRFERSWYCECCGGITDATLTVEVDGQVVGAYQDDGHFGYSHINDAEVETDIAKALGVEKEYEALCARRDEVDAKRSAALEAAKTDEEEDLVYQAHGGAWEEFPAWLEGLGHTVVEEYDSECDMSSFDDDYDDEEESADAEFEQAPA